MNTENLRSFLQGDAVWILGAIAVLTCGSKLGVIALGFNFSQ